MKIRRAAVGVAVVVAGVMAVPAGALAYASSGDGPNAVGLTNAGSKLTRFDTDQPKWASKAVAVKGLSGDSSLVGIDRRVQNGKLYGVGNKGGIYTLRSRTAKATKVGQLSVALSGSRFGVDFNPAANALRVISDNGQNLRQPFGMTDGPSAPTVADGALNYMAVTATGVTAAAYTNNDSSADTATSLFDLDTTLDQVVLQAPANSGSLSPTGKLGVNAGANAGFDIYSKVTKGKATGATGFAALSVSDWSGLYSVNLLTGEADLEGKFPFAVSDIAVALDD